MSKRAEAETGVRTVAGATAGAAGGGMHASVAAAAVSAIPASLYVDRLKMCRVKEPWNWVLFDHNPTKYTVKRERKLTTRGSTRHQGATSASVQANEMVVSHGDDPQTIVLNGGLLVGPTAKTRAETLMSWMNPTWGNIDPTEQPPSETMLAARPLNQLEPPTILLQWGPPFIGLTLKARITICLVTYERVDNMGIPLRAMVNLTVAEVPSWLSLTPTNPTSGGRAGRRQHVVVEGETLAGIARKNYGTPAAWRRLAELNRIDNPNALRPGDRLLVPSQDELNEVRP